MPVKIIRAAFREIQKLSHENFQTVCQIITRPEGYSDIKKLHGYDDLWRTRDGKVRVIWKPEDPGNILVIKAGLRGDVYDRVFDSRQQDDARIVEELINPNGTPLAENPAYEIPQKKAIASEWNQEAEDTWYKFVYGGYRYSPLLTPHQRSVLSELSSHSTDTKAWLVQSAPGTGKTVCAALIACELHQKQQWNTMIVVPEALRRDIAEYSEVKKTCQQKPEGFWLGTFPEWLSKVAPKLGSRLATPVEELEALRKVLTTKHHLKIKEINPQDVLLYQAFVLDWENSNQDKNAIYQANKTRIETLRAIRSEWWKQMLGDRICRLDAARELKSNPPKPLYSSKPTILIVDEAQDFFLAELQALKAVRKAWSKPIPTYLWILGDLNQRIVPVDFDFGRLHLGRTIELKYNYRNSQSILEFANQFLEVARQENSRNNGRGLPPQANPEYAVEKGEPVYLLECSSKEKASEFLDFMTKESWQGQGERYFLQQSANQIKVLWTNPLQQNYESSNIEIFNAEKAKGREFEACVAFRIFEKTDKSLLEESLQWYTLLTRPRSRLLVVATTEELNRIGSKYFEYCQRVNPEEAASWIAEVASGVELTIFRENVQQTKNKLLKACEEGFPYLDSYLVLQLAGVEGDKLYEWELEAISKLRNNSDNLEIEFHKININNITIRCLLLRAMHRSWEAVEEASRLQKSNEREYKRLIESIGRDLTNKNLPYEAARVLTRIGQPWPDDYPFPEIAHKSGELISLLYQAILDRPFPDV